MKVLLDAVHPADVWVLGAVEDRLLAAGGETLWISRPGKDPVVELIENRGRPHVAGPEAGTNRRTLARELLARDLLVWRTVRRFSPDVILTRSPAGVHAGRLTRTPVLYDTDDGRAAGLLYYVAGPLADMITSPSATADTYGPRHRKYRGYKELFYLHPSRFTADATIRTELGLSPDERLFVLRLSALTASHDFGERGLAREHVDLIVERLSSRGAVVVSSESPLRSDLSALRVRAPLHRFHHVLAAADLVVGDSQTVCAEAGVIGTPSLNCSSWSGRLPYQIELQERWNLIKTFKPEDHGVFLRELDCVLDDLEGVRAAQSQRRAEMLDWCGDPLDEFLSWTCALAAPKRGAE